MRPYAQTPAAPAASVCEVNALAGVAKAFFLKKFEADVKSRCLHHAQS